jgi:hypothetical protein
MLSSAPKMTIKKFAHDYFMRVSFIDIYGRNIGYDYDFILEEIKRTFPDARTSRRWLQDMAYILNRSARLPVRRRSRRTLAEDYAMSLLLRPYLYGSVRDAVRKKFPEHGTSLRTLRSLEVRLRNRGFTIPPRQ